MMSYFGLMLGFADSPQPAALATKFGGKNVAADVANKPNQGNRGRVKIIK